MKAEKKIFVLTRGSYSDYNIVGVYTTKARAKVVKAYFDSEDSYDDDCTIEVYELNTVADMLKRGYKQFTVLMNYNGTIESIREEISTYRNPLHVWKRSTAPGFKGINISDAVNGTVWAKDSNHAIKICNEFRTRAIAMHRMGAGKGKK